ncbi:MAG: phosphate acyltransferase PlsX [Endomicrobiia bacterium]
MIKVIVDAMGGDKDVPGINVLGSLQALVEEKNLKIFLTGPKDTILKKLKEPSICSKKVLERLEVIDVKETVEMDEQPSKALRNKRESTIAVGIKMLKEGKGDAFISAGNSGAIAAFALTQIGTIKGIDRPAISTIFPTVKGKCVMLDMGANVDCKPKQILDFAYMGDAYCRSVLHNDNPRVGLLSIGHEEGKGNMQSLEAYELLKKSTKLNFIGNVEGKDIPAGDVDVVVCDGFVGNVILKFGEGVASMLLKLIKDSLKKHPLSFIALPFVWGTITDLRKKVDFTEYGGAPLLGLEKICLICHGRSNAKAIKNAIKTAKQLVEKNINSMITKYFNGATG